MGEFMSTGPHPIRHPEVLLQVAHVMHDLFQHLQRTRSIALEHWDTYLAYMEEFFQILCVRDASDTFPPAHAEIAFATLAWRELWPHTRLPPTIRWCLARTYLEAIRSVRAGQPSEPFFGLYQDMEAFFAALENIIGDYLGTQSSETDAAGPRIRHLYDIA